MNAKKFGSFLAALRKEQDMTQAELASKLQVTDKAVSRWERGIGLPDISMLEPLSEALHITVLELLRSEKMNEQELTPEDVSETVIETIKIATEQKKSLINRLLAIGAGVIGVLAIPVLALFVGYTSFPFLEFFLFFIPMCILFVIEYVLCGKNKMIAAILPIIVAFSGFAFGVYPLVIGIALFAEFFVIQYMDKSMKGNLMILLATVFICGLSGCGKTDALSQYNWDGVYSISYTDIDTVCETQELTEAGANILSDLEEQLLLSLVVDSSIEITEELENYDHLIVTNPQWIERFGESGKLMPVEYGSLSNSMQEFLDAQMPIWTVDGSTMPDGVGLYQYEGGKLFAFPVNVTLGVAKPVEAENPLIILVDRPVQTFKADSFMLPLTSSGNVLFTDDEFQKVFEESKLRDYGTVQEMKG